MWSECSIEASRFYTLPTQQRLEQVSEKMADNPVVSHLQYAHKVVFDAKADKTGCARHHM